MASEPLSGALRYFLETGVTDQTRGFRVSVELRAELLEHIRALQADAAALREALEEALTGLKWWQATYPDGCSEADAEFEERAQAALSSTAKETP